ncbi:MAG: YfbM family protein [Myxococcales bacterium]|nr:YfbM family protein [Myxococcales bacterium]
MGMIGYVARLPEAAFDDLGAIAAVIEASYDDDDEGGAVCVEKLWQAIPFVLSGGGQRGGALGQLFVGGAARGADVGYGPARLHGREAVAEMARELANLTTDELRGTFDPTKLDAAGVYPSIWDEDPEDLWDELRYYVEAMRRLVTEAARAGDGLVTWIA